jgi:hypothetical protein
MSITNAPVDPRELSTPALAREIAVECDRALRRLDSLLRERDEVLVAHARAFVRRAASLSELIVRAERGGQSYRDG